MGGRVGGWSGVWVWVCVNMCVFLWVNVRVRLCIHRFAAATDGTPRNSAFCSAVRSVAEDVVEGCQAAGVYDDEGQAIATEAPAPKPVGDEDLELERRREARPPAPPSTPLAAVSPPR